MIFDKRRQELVGLRDRHQARLDQLAEKVATYGYSVDPSVKLEIEDIEREMAQLSATIEALNTVHALILQKDKNVPYQQDKPLDDRRDNENRLQTMIATVQATVGAVATLENKVNQGFTDFRQDFNEFRNDVREEFAQRDKWFLGLLALNIGLFVILIFK